MQLKHQGLTSSLKKALLPVYVLAGPERYFIEEEAKAIKAAYALNREVDHKLLTVDSSEDWQQIEEEANSYSLFASYVFLDVRYEKKSIDRVGKKIIANYLSSVNQRCLLLIRCPHVPLSQLQWLSASDKTVLVSAYPPSLQDMRNWIAKQLQQHQLKFTAHIPDIILHKVQGNMFACSQALEKITLIYPAGSTLQANEMLQQLSDQSEYQLYDLSEACLAGNTENALRILGKLLILPNEYSLILWIITQEIRLLLQLKHLLQQQRSLTEACAELKVWKQRVRLYQAANERLSSSLLQQLMLTAHNIDLLIKTGKNSRHVARLLESSVLSFCQGQSE